MKFLDTVIKNLKPQADKKYYKREANGFAICVYPTMVAEAKKAAAKTYASSKGKKVHVVKKGDTLSAIARRYGTTTKALCQKNGIKSTSTLKLGQKIRL